MRYEPFAVDVGTSSQPWTYTAANMLAAIPGYISSTAYEPAGQTKTIVYANGVSTTFTYSATRRWLTRVQTTAPGGVVLMDRNYVRDLAGRITSIDTLGGTMDDWNYSYNALDWLLSVNNVGDNTLDETFSYSASGNLLSRTRLAGAFAYPAGSAVRPHAPLSLGAAAIGYDANGNMVADGTRLLAWDEANRLSSVEIGAALTAFGYGPDGSGARKTTATTAILYAAADVEIDDSDVKRRGTRRFGCQNAMFRRPPSIRQILVQSCAANFAVAPEGTDLERFTISFVSVGGAPRVS